MVVDPRGLACRTLLLSTYSGSGYVGQCGGKPAIDAAIQSLSAKSGDRDASGEAQGLRGNGPGSCSVEGIVALVTYWIQ
jgi:hypothetical protein